MSTVKLRQADYVELLRNNAKIGISKQDSRINVCHARKTAIEKECIAKGKLRGWWHGVVNAESLHSCEDGIAIATHIKDQLTKELDLWTSKTHTLIEVTISKDQYEKMLRGLYEPGYNRF